MHNRLSCRGATGLRFETTSKQVRTHLIETARPTLEVMVLEVTGVEVISLHHDISTTTGEEVVLFRLQKSPLLREKTKS